MHESEKSILRKDEPKKDWEEMMDAVHHIRVKVDHASPDLVYRGQSCAGWGIVPSALRHLPIELNGKHENPFDILSSQFVRETHDFEAFYKQVDQQGLRLPTIGAMLHRRFISGVNYDPNEPEVMKYDRALYWPPNNLLPLLALAQHYGIPTRLLDWSNDPYVALYFAAIEALTRKDGSEELALWIADRRYIEKRLGPQTHPSPLSFEFIDSPYHENPNLAAQQGIFSLARLSHTWMAKQSASSGEKAYQLTRMSMEFAIEESLKSLPQDHSQSGELDHQDTDSLKLFIKMTLPIGEAAPLLISLRKLGYHGGSMFPGYKGCVKSVNELKLIREYEATRK